MYDSVYPGHGSDSSAAVHKMPLFVSSRVRWCNQQVQQFLCVPGKVHTNVFLNVFIVKWMLFRFRAANLVHKIITTAR